MSLRLGVGLDWEIWRCGEDIGRKEGGGRERVEVKKIGGMDGVGKW